MPLYMYQFKYTSEAWAKLEKHPEDRRIAVSKLLEQLGGKLINIFYTFGEFDGLVIYEAPDNITALATVLDVIAPGHVKETKTTALFTVEEALKAMKKAGKFKLEKIK